LIAKTFCIYERTSFFPLSIRRGGLRKNYLRELCGGEVVEVQGICVYFVGAFKSTHMALKITKAVWFFSLIIFLAVFFYNYAGLGESVTIYESTQPLILSKELLFYLFIVMVVIMNLFVFLVNKIYPATAAEFKVWFYGLIITLNIFFTIAINYISLYNSAEKFDYQRIGVIIYGSLILILAWLVAWPLFSIARKYLFK
jgi:hypothetical protein